MVERDQYQVLGLGGAQHLLFEHHHHQVVQLAHAGLVESHNGGVRQVVEEASQRRFAVHFLWFEQLVQKLLVQHDSGDVVEH